MKQHDGGDIPHGRRPRNRRPFMSQHDQTRSPLSAKVFSMVERCESAPLAKLRSLPSSQSARRQHMSTIATRTTIWTRSGNDKQPARNSKCRRYFYVAEAAGTFATESQITNFKLLVGAPRSSCQRVSAPPVRPTDKGNPHCVCNKSTTAEREIEDHLPGQDAGCLHLGRA